MRILITGGCGFLGSNLAASFLAEEAEVVIVDALFRKGSVSNLHWLEEQDMGNQLHFIQADVADSESVFSIFRRHAPFDYVCHVGGQVAMTSSLQDPLRDLQTNVVGTFNILEAIRNLSADSLLAYSSTNKVYGDLEWLHYEETDTRYFLPDYPQGLDEKLPLDFSTPYGCSKGSADQYVRDWARVYGLKTIVFRHSSIYGGRQFASFDQGWIGWFCQQALAQRDAIRNGGAPQPFTIAGTGKQVRDVLHASDLVALYKQAYNLRERYDGEILNIGGGVENSLSLLELFTLLSRLLGIDRLHFQATPRRSSDQDYFVSNNTKATRLLDWQPKMSCEAGIQSMLTWSQNIMS